jgi:hypothetical protein
MHYFSIGNDDLAVFDGDSFITSRSYWLRVISNDFVFPIYQQLPIAMYGILVKSIGQARYFSALRHQVPCDSYVISLSDLVDSLRYYGESATANYFNSIMVRRKKEIITLPNDVCLVENIILH